MGWQSQIVKRCRWGEPPYCAWSRCSSISVFFAAVLLPPLGAALHAMLVAAETSTTRLAVPAGGVAAPRRLEYCTGRRWRFSSASRGDRQVLELAESRETEARARLRPHGTRVHRCGRLKRRQGGRIPKETPPAMRRRRCSAALAARELQTASDAAGG